MRTGAVALAFLLALSAPIHAETPLGADYRSAPAPSAPSGIISYMRGYIGTNPTGWSARWCGKFLDMALRATGHPGGGNLARAYAKYGSAAAGPCVGCLAVWGGHVGVVTGIDSNGNVIVISGNVSGRVYEGVSRRGRPIAWRVP